MTNIPMTVITCKLFNRTAGNSQNLKGCNRIIAFFFRPMNPSSLLNEDVLAVAEARAGQHEVPLCAPAKSRSSAPGAARMAKDKLRLGS